MEKMNKIIIGLMVALLVAVGMQTVTLAKLSLQLDGGVVGMAQAAPASVPLPDMAGGC